MAGHAGAASALVLLVAAAVGVFLRAAVFLKTDVALKAAGDECAGATLWGHAEAAAHLLGGQTELALEAWSRSCADPEACAKCAESERWLYDRALEALLPEPRDPEHEAAGLQLLSRSVAVSAPPPASSHEALECLRPKDLNLERRQFNEQLQNLPLAPGRVCGSNGECPLNCGLSVFDDFLSPEEAAALVRHGEHVLGLHRATRHPQPYVDLHVSARHGYGPEHLLLLRTLARLRRLIVHAAGVPDSWVGVASHFLARTDSKGNGGGKPNIHCDEASVERFHFSGVLWLTGGEVEGGAISFWDGNRSEWRTSVPTAVGRSVVFSSGWENIHQVEEVRNGVRYSLPLFATVAPPERGVRLAQECANQKANVPWEQCEPRLARWLHALDL